MQSISRDTFFGFLFKRSNEGNANSKFFFLALVYRFLEAVQPNQNKNYFWCPRWPTLSRFGVKQLAKAKPKSQVEVKKCNSFCIWHSIPISMWVSSFFPGFLQELEKGKLVCATLLSLLSHHNQVARSICEIAEEGRSLEEAYVSLQPFRFRLTGDNSCTRWKLHTTKLKQKRKIKNKMNS